METKDLVLFLRGYIIAIKEKGQYLLADRLEQCADRLEDQEQSIMVWMRAFDILNDRENRHHYLEYWREKNGKNDLTYPDGDEIYKDFFAMMADRDHLLEVAEKMHEWIFLHSADEKEVYRRCGLTDEDDARLGYGGQFVIECEGEDGNT